MAGRMDRFKATRSFEVSRGRPGREVIRDDWILRVIQTPELEEMQPDGRIRRWARIPEAEGRYRRVKR